MSEPMSGQDDEISLLDLAVVIAESWVLLLVGPVIIAAIAFVLTSTQPVSLRSETTLAVDNAVIFTDRAFVADVVGGDLADEVLAGLSVSQGATEGETVIALTLGDDGDPQALLEDLVAAFEAQYYQPLLAEQNEALQVERSAALARIERINDAIPRVTAAIDRVESQTPFDGMALAALFATLSQLQNDALIHAEQLELLETEALSEATEPGNLVVSPPSNNAPASGRSPVLIAALAGLGAGFVLLIFVFIRNGLQNSRANPETRAKIARIRKAFYLKA